MSFPHPSSSLVSASRRRVLQQGLAALAATGILRRTAFAKASSAAEMKVQSAHAEIWRRFMDEYDVMIDFTALDGSVIIPTPEECQQGKPNALGWWSPIENGSMFNGMYVEAMLNRWQVTQQPEDAEKARKLAKGLMNLASVSSVKGFLARGISTDGKSHYPMGSNDQSFPWIYGMWRYLSSSIPTKEERETMKAKLFEAVEVIVALGWKNPAEPPFNIRGEFGLISFESASRLLFICKMMHQLTNDDVWKQRYLTSLDERGGKENLSRREICARGMVFEHGGKHSWTSVSPVLGIRGMWEMEDDPALKADFAKGLEASADLAIQSFPLIEKFPPQHQERFEPNWRLMNATWKPQTNEHESVKLAQDQLKEFIKHSPARALETAYVREPVFAAWIVALAPDAARLKERAPQIEKVIAHYDYTRLYYSQFFPVECAWWKLRLALASN